MDELYGIKLLSLYKQHYRDSYKESMNFQYSSWGYYDGFDITDPENHKNRLSKKITALPISDMWFGMEDLKRKSNGKMACQTIGIFRNSEDDPWAEQFWSENEDYPFFAIGFLQMISCKTDNTKIRMQDIMTFQNMIDQLGFHDVVQKDAFCRCLAYYTLDNSDMVVLFHSNSLSFLQRRISEIENFTETSYMHTILGTSEKYLRACEVTILNQWQNGINCHLDDSVFHLTMRLVTRNPQENKSIFRYLLEKHIEKWPLKGYENAELSECFGHESVSLRIRETDVRSLLGFLLPGGLATHQSSLYNFGLYNFQTSFALSNTDVHNIEPLKIDTTTDKKENNWCIDTINIYRGYLDRISGPEIYDESMITYLNAIIQSLNTLAQYENFQMSKNIFYLLYPAFRMFTECFTETMNEGLDHPEVYNTTVKYLRKNIDLFLEAANSVIYHTIHTDQIFLMLPGYSGTSYAIPIKLQLLYLGFMKKVGFVLNDRDESDMEKGRLPYSFLIAPLNEAPPLAEKIAFKGNRNNALVRITVSQRSLSFPRDLMIILSHECAHYIGQKIRIRHFRAAKICNTMAILMADMLFSSVINSKPEKNTSAFEVWKVFANEYHGHVAEKCYNYLSFYLRDRENKQSLSKEKEEVFFASNLEPILKEACTAVIGGIDTPETMFPSELEEKIRSIIIADKKNLSANVTRFNGYMASVGKARQRILAGGYISKSIKVIIRLYKELFSDLAAGVLLESTADDMKEAMLVSEGMKMLPNEKRESVLLREELMEALLAEKEETDTSQIMAIDANAENEVGTIEEIFKSLIDHRTVRQGLLIYGKECKIRLLSRLEQSEEIKMAVREVRRLYSCFKDDSSDRMDLYKNIGDFIISYSDEIEKMYMDA